MSASTLIEMGSDGSRTVFHRQGDKAWTHPKDDHVMVDFDQRLSCPVCVAFADRKEVVSTLPPGRKSECDRGHGPREWGLKKTGYGYCRRCYREAEKARQEAAKTALPVPQGAERLAAGS
ncbi:MAG TPA: hypothetical protein VFI59_09665 [Actinomycetota bacterium]|nr:hypothetical protein [Actinomycetota bacterium]